MFWPAVAVSAVMLTARAATASSSWKRVWVYVPGLSAGLLKITVDASGVHQYCAVLSARPTRAVERLATPDAPPLSGGRGAIRERRGLWWSRPAGDSAASPP